MTKHPFIGTGAPSDPCQFCGRRFTARCNTPQGKGHATLLARKFLHEHEDAHRRRRARGLDDSDLAKPAAERKAAARIEAHRRETRPEQSLEAFPASEAA